MSARHCAVVLVSAALLTACGGKKPVLPPGSAQAGVRKSWGADSRIGTVLNIDATQILLETCVGRPTERFIYATFVADAARATADVGSRRTPGRVYNIGGGTRATLLDVFEILGRASGRPLDVDRRLPQKDDMRDTYADTTLARADLGCAPPVALEQGLTAMDQWFVTRPS